MKDILFKISDKVGIRSQRTKNISKHVLLSFIYRAGSVLASFLLVPLTLNYLDTENYGIWLTISSFITWFTFFDGGLGHGLRNRFAECKAKGNYSSIKGYISTAYYTIGLVSLTLIFIFILLNYVISWDKVFNTNQYLKKDLFVIMPIIFSFFCLKLVVNLLISIYKADQYHSIQLKIQFYVSIASLVVIWILTNFTNGSLILYSFFFSAIPFTILLIFNIYAFNDRYKHYKPKFSFWKWNYLNDIFGIGIKFFIIQISGIILFSTDNLIITNLYGPSSVVPYALSLKYFSISIMISGTVFAPYWSTFTEALVQEDFNWIKNSMKSLMFIVLSISIIILIMLIISPYIFDLWLGKKVIIDNQISGLMALFFMLTVFYTPFTMFINGSGKIQLQLISLLAVAIINIPLSIFISINLNFGVRGIILATILCIIPHTILMPIQYFKIINKRASGIWNS